MCDLEHRGSPLLKMGAAPLRRRREFTLSSPLGISFKQVVGEDLSDDCHLFVTQRRCGLADPPDVLVVRSRTQHVVQVGHSNERLGH